MRPSLAAVWFMLVSTLPYSHPSQAFFSNSLSKDMTSPALLLGVVHRAFHSPLPIPKAFTQYLLTNEDIVSEKANMLINDGLFFQKSDCQRQEPGTQWIFPLHGGREDPSAPPVHQQGSLTGKQSLWNYHIEDNKFRLYQQPTSHSSALTEDNKSNYTVITHNEKKHPLVLLFFEQGDDLCHIPLTILSEHDLFVDSASLVQGFEFTAGKASLIPSLEDNQEGLSLQEQALHNARHKKLLQYFERVLDFIAEVLPFQRVNSNKSKINIRSNTRPDNDKWLALCGGQSYTGRQAMNNQGSTSSGKKYTDYELKTGLDSGCINRVNSFVGSPYEIKHMHPLARNGFAYRDTFVFCPWCKVQVDPKQWEDNANIMAKHEISCDFVNPRAYLIPKWEKISTEPTPSQNRKPLTKKESTHGETDALGKSSPYSASGVDQNSTNTLGTKPKDGATFNEPMPTASAIPNNLTLESKKVDPSKLNLTEDEQLAVKAIERMDYSFDEINAAVKILKNNGQTVTTEDLLDTIWKQQ